MTDHNLQNYGQLTSKSKYRVAYVSSSTPETQYLNTENRGLTV